MRRTRALVLLVALATVATFTGAAHAVEPEPPGTVQVSTQVSPSSGMSVSAGRVVWGDGLYVHKRTLSAQGSTVALGPWSRLGLGDLSPYGYLTHSSSGDRTLWASEYGNSDLNFATKLTSGATTKILKVGAVPVRVSGNRVLYQGQYSGQHYYLYDLHTGKTVDVTEKYGTRTSSRTFTVDLFGNYLVYTTKSFAIMRKNLSDSSAPVTVVPAAHNGYNGAKVLAYGDWVAWDRYSHPTDGFDAYDHCGLKNMRTMAPATKTCAYDLTSAGALYRSTSGGGTVNSWTLQPYGSIDRITLPVPTSTTNLGLADNLMVWADADNLHAAPTTYPYRPRSLGDPTTTPGYRIGGAAWGFRLVSTAKLTKCHVVISRQGVQVRDLPCDATAMTTGQVLVHWDGRSSSGHQAAPGTYRWSIGASNTFGSMLRSDGSLRTSTGTLTVTR